jgi:surface polysaccharide O-acyltransferase-like enzyme
LDNNSLKVLKLRLASVDSIRLIAILSVIAIHTRPFSLSSEEFNSLYYYLDHTINQLARFAVPFFFAISGYFYGVKINKVDCPRLTAKRMLLKLTILYLGWCLIYFMPYNLSIIYEYGLLGSVKVAYWNLLNSIDNPINLIFQGSKVHLWFLVSLILCTSITSIFVKTNNIPALFLLSLILYFIGVFAKSYSATELGIKIDFNTRNGPFFGMLLFVTGYWLSSKTPTKRWFHLGGIIFSLGVLTHFTEIYILMKLYKTSMLQDFVFGTYFMGIGATLISLSNHKVLSNKMFSSIGKMTLGIYASHLIFVDLLRPVDKLLNHPLWELVFVILVLGLSVMLTKLLSKSKYTKKLVE